MDEAERLLTNAADVARQATTFDAGGSHQAAIYMYRQAAAYLEYGQNLGLSNPSIADRIQQYRNRAEILEQNGNLCHLMIIL